MRFLSQEDWCGEGEGGWAGGCLCPAHLCACGCTLRLRAHTHVRAHLLHTAHSHVLHWHMHL